MPGTRDSLHIVENLHPCRVSKAEGASSGDQAAAANADAYDFSSRLNITIAASHNEHTGKRNGLSQLQLAVDAISTTHEAVE